MATTSSQSALHNATVIARDRLCEEIRRVLVAFPVTDIVSLLDEHDQVGSYKYRSRRLMTYDEQVRASFPEEVAKYHAAVVLTLIERSIKNIDSYHLTSEVAALCLANFARIVRNIDSCEFDYMQFPVDRFDKDLAAATMRLICAGARKLHEVYLPANLVKRHPYIWAKCGSRIGLRGTMYRMHTDANDPFLMAEFNEEGWRRFCLRAAALLKASPVNGILGASWFYDPALKDISPHLSYLRTLATDNGGISLRMGTSASDIESATRTSATRRRMYQSGRYLPQAYALIWLKEDMLRWAGLDAPARGYQQGSR